MDGLRSEASDQISRGHLCHHVGFLMRQHANLIQLVGGFGDM